MSDEVYIRDFTLVMAHSFVRLGFCASVALRTTSRPINVPFSSLSRFLSFYEFSQVLLGAPLSQSFLSIHKLYRNPATQVFANSPPHKTAIRNPKGAFTKLTNKS